MSAAFSQAAHGYFLAHAIDHDLAAGLGVGELDGALTFRYQDSDGEYRRRRPLDGSRTFQPPGRPLTLWWPDGRPEPGRHVLLCEGESDALSALTAIRSMNGAAPIAAPTVAALPGCGHGRAVDDLRAAGVGSVTVCLDGDDAGRKAADRICAGLVEAGAVVSRIDPGDGKDLADVLCAAEDGGDALAQLLADAAPAEPATVEPSGEAPNTPAIRFLSPEELRATVPPEPPWRLHGYLAAGALTVLAGKPKAGKSTLALAISRAVSTARVTGFLGHAIDGGPVVYVSEEGASTLAHKLAGDLRVATRETAWPRPEWPAMVAAAVEEANRVDAALVVIDTFAFWAALGQDAEKDAGAVQAAMEPLVAATSAGLAVLLVAHSRKGGGEDGEGLRGSTALAGAADIVLELERVKGGPPRHRELLALSRYPQTPGVLVVSHEAATGLWSVIGEGTDRGDGRDISDRTAILVALDGGGELTRPELEAATGAQERQWHGTMEQLIAAGAVTKLGAGKKGDPFRFQILRTGAAQKGRRNGQAADSDAAAPRRGQHQNHNGAESAGAHHAQKPTPRQSRSPSVRLSAERTPDDGQLATDEQEALIERHRDPLTADSDSQLENWRTLIDDREPAAQRTLSDEGSEMTF